MSQIPELLAPAGSLKTMYYAFAYGADAVYAGAARYSLRMRGNEFNDERIRIGIAEAHAQDKRFFLTVNTQPHNYKLHTALRDLAPLIEAAPDALIMSDPGLIMEVRKRYPDMPVHLSVQANTVNWATVKFWQSVGIGRCILSRELSLKEIAEIREKCPDMEIEVFVHGALCIAYSGRCLLSGYFNNRDPNQGTCTNACRWKYTTHASRKAEEGEFIPAEPFRPDDLACVTGGERRPAADSVYYLEEVNRPGEYLEISEDDNGSYIMNSRDLRAIEHIAALVEIGVDCLKIEGRTKSHYYAARTAQLYRWAIDDAIAGRAFDPSLKTGLDGLVNRGYTDGFFVRRQIKAQQNYHSGSSNAATQQFVGEVVAYDAEKGLATIAAKNHFQSGDTVEVITPKGNRHVTLGRLFEPGGDAVIAAAKGSGWQVETNIGPVDKLALLAKNL